MSLSISSFSLPVCWSSHYHCLPTYLLCVRQKKGPTNPPPSIQNDMILSAQHYDIYTRYVLSILGDVQMCLISNVPLDMQIKFHLSMTKFDLPYSPCTLISSFSLPVCRSSHYAPLLKKKKDKNKCITPSPTPPHQNKKKRNKDILPALLYA